MLKKTDIDFFFTNGYLLVKQVYDPADIETAREFFLMAFRKGLWKNSRYNSRDIINDIYRMYPELLDIVINETYAAALKSILGNDVIWLPECAVHYNRFINWHSDTTEQEIKGVKSHKNPHQFLLQCATYFQPNSAHGGGLTVIPGSHLSEDRFLDFYRKGIFWRIINKVRKVLRMSLFDVLDRSDLAVNIPTEPGDLLIFDVRLCHKSSGNGSNAPQIDKFAIFNTFGNANAFTREYLGFMKKRPEPSYKFMQDTLLPENVYKKAQDLDIKIWN